MAVCKKCKEIIPEDAKECPYCHEVVRTDIKKKPQLIPCPKCGKLISERARKCPQCGYEIEAHDEIVEDSIHNSNQQDIIKQDAIESIENNKIDNNAGLNLGVIEPICKVTKVELTAERLKKITDINGWLMLFLFLIGLGAVVSFIVILATSNFDSSTYDLIFAWGDVTLGIFYLLLAGYAIYAFVERKPNAVFVAKSYMVYLFVVNIVGLLVGNYESSGIGSLSHLIGALIWNIVWFVYLSVSKQVGEVIPKEYREYKKINTWIIVLMVGIPLFFMILGSGYAISHIDNGDVNSIKGENVIEAWSIGINENTDGKIIFESPTGFDCNSGVVEGMKYYEMEDENNSITLLSDYDSEVSKRNFVNYWNAWAPKELDDYDWSIIKDETVYLSKMITYFYRVVKVDVEGTFVYWRYMLVFDENTSKVALISAYDSDGDDDYVMELLHSIRFEN